MIELSRKVKTTASADIAYNILKNTARFPKFISGIEAIEMKEKTGKFSRNAWSINMQNTNVKWEEEEISDGINKRISFKRVAGDFDLLEGIKAVNKTKDGSEIYVSLKIDWTSNKAVSELLIRKKATLALRWMLRSIREHLDAESIILYEHSDKTNRTIISELIKYKNRSGKQIVGFLDYLKTDSVSTDFVIIPPGYGETKRDAITLSYYLASNGFNVIRYDATDHVGESQGDIFYTTLPKMKNDIIASIDYIQHRFKVEKIGIIASSLANRVALKAASEDVRISFLLGLVGIVNLRATLEAVYSQDLIGIVETCKDKSFDVAEVLGHEVSREFPSTAIKEKYHDLKSTKDDVKKLKCPFVFIVAEKDTWVRLEDVKLVFESSSYPDKELHIIQDTLHLIYENPKSTRSVLKQAVASCKKYMPKEECAEPQVIEPGIRQIATQNKIEKLRLRRLTEITKNGEKEFWQSYLNKYIVITKSKDFRDLLSLVELLLGTPKEAETILDAGCGNGHFGAWLLWTATARCKELNGMYVPAKHRQYIGVDFIQDVLDEAKKRHAEIQANMAKELSVKDSFIDMEYHCLDLEKTLPFNDNSFDKICCNLVISYLKNPFFSLKELFRVLKPGGRIVITSLKPHPDLSYIYKNFVSSANDEEEIKEARLLLSGAGKIKQRESEGHYCFFSERQFKGLFSRLKAVNVKDYRTFGDQVIVIAGEKPE
jgi:SAM-dependent methyltransferase/ribosome-associated toxin RatA of RatAB toxin-antitoxin module